MKKKFAKRRNQLQKAYTLLGANDPIELTEKYLEHDQRMMREKVADYHNPKHITNKIRRILEEIDARGLSTLSEKERYERKQILWLWYHHATSYAIWSYQDKRGAQKYSALALRYQPKPHPNQITRLLYLLVRDRIEEAKRWAKRMRKTPEKTSARNLLKLYLEGRFFV